MKLLSLDEVDARDRRKVGGKAVGLALLVARGIPVPAAVIIQTGELKRFLHSNGLWDVAVRGDLRGLSTAITQGRLDPIFTADLHAATASLGDRLAVRSSGVDEDGEDSSHAGQYLTRLGVSPGAAVERAVLECWASVYSTTALSYRGGRRPVPGNMAVVIQTMVEPRCAGVMFTINPLKGSWREMTVEAAWGLGEAVVSGRVVPDFYLVRRPRRAPRPVQRVLARVQLELIERQLRPQTHLWQVGSTAPERVEVSPARVDRPKLEPQELYRLCRLGLRIEGFLGGSQDVEWAMDEQGELYILQARPVTSSQDVGRSGEVIWTRRFGGERWTEPATPLGWSEMRELLDWFIAYPETSRLFLGGERPTRLFRSAPYFNVTVFRHLAFKAPGAPPPRFMVELLPPDEERGWLRRHAQAPDLRVYRSILGETWRERRWRRFRWNPFLNWRAWDDFLAGLGPALAALPPLGELADARQRLTRCRELARDYIRVHICSLLFANIWYQIAQAGLRAHGGDAIAHTLLQPPQDSWTARTNQALWALGKGSLKLEDFQARFGHRAINSWEIFSPRWAEDPSEALRLAQGIAIGDEPRSSVSGERERSASGIAALPWALRQVVILTRRYLQLREDQRFHFDHILWMWKQTYLWLEAHHGLLLRFLELRELEAFLDEEMSRSAALKLIERREQEWRAEVERWRAGDPPPVFLVGDQVAEQLHGSALRLQGTGISAGVVTGPVRIIQNLDQADRLRRGEILVVQATDPAWTPLFLTAGGLVMEMGGMLSHGAVVAREYGLPAVVNVPRVMSRLTDGQVVTVDGSRGVVWIR